MTTPRDPSSDGPSGVSRLPPHLDPRAPRRGTSPRVTRASRKTAHGGPTDPGTALGTERTTGPKQPRGRRTRGQRITQVLSWVALSTAVVVLVTAGGLYVAFNHYNGQINRIAIPGIGGFSHPKKTVRGAENILLVGSDSRAGANGIGTQGIGATFVTGQRSDTVILVHLFGNSDKAELVSFPRDSYVEIPAYTDPKTGHVTPTHHEKLNSAFALGGPALLIATIEKLSNIRVDHFLQIDFTGFKGMVNKLGGVNVCLTKPAKDSFSGIDMSAGNHHISGDVALAFVRQRHGLALGDIDRIARQQQFIGSLVRKVLSAGTLLDPFKLNGFLDVATSSLQADQGLSGGDIKTLALRLRHFNSGGVIFQTVPIADIGGSRNGESVVLLDGPKDAALFQALQADQAPGTPAPAKAAAGAKAPAAPAVTIAPGNVRVAVFNGSGINGLGRKAAESLGSIGFQIIGVPATRGSGATQTVISYGPTRADSARTLQAALPGSILQADPSLGRTLGVVIGSSYSGAQKVTVTAPAPTASATPAGPNAAVPVKTAQDNPCTA